MIAVPEQLSAAGLPSASETEAIADQLVLLAHRCVDWETWGGARAMRYWDALTERVRASCYAGPSLSAWWVRLSTTMGLGAPSNKADRALLAQLLGHADQRGVLRVLRTQTDTTVLRVRCAIDTAKETK